MLDLVIKWQDITIQTPNWLDFNLDDIMHMPVRHAVSLFSHEIPIIIKQGNRYIVNTKELFDSYRKSGRNVIMLEQIDGGVMDHRVSGGFFPC